jgi:glycosyltransferase involved in cell wall biosynthesis
MGLRRPSLRRAEDHALHAVIWLGTSFPPLRAHMGLLVKPNVEPLSRWEAIRRNGKGPADPRVVIAHDFLETYGGAERVTQEMALAFPDAPVVGILGRPAVARRMGIASRWRPLLPARPALLRRYRQLTPVFPAMVRAARLPAADVLLSSSYAFAHHFRLPGDAPQVCYCHSPLRFAWSMTDDYRERWATGAVARTAFQALAAAMRHSDRHAAWRVAAYCTQSPFTGQQIERFYGRRAQVIGAPVDCHLFRPSPRNDHDGYVLLCGRLIEPYKKMGVAIDALTRLGRRTVVAGDGPAMAELRARAGTNVTFLGHLGDEDVVRMMQRAAFLLFPSRDDFGLIPVEAMACGRPVLAYDGGGAKYTVVPGVTGELFPEQTTDCITHALEAFEPDLYDSAAVRRHAEQWDRHVFRERLREAVVHALP